MGSEYKQTVDFAVKQGWVTFPAPVTLTDEELESARHKRYYWRNREKILEKKRISDRAKSRALKLEKA